jgi:hypothetical protein
VVLVRHERVGLEHRFGPLASAASGVQAARLDPGTGRESSTRSVPLFLGDNPGDAENQLTWMIIMSPPPPPISTLLLVV